LVNGKRAVYILVTKRANASTLDVVDNVRNNLPQMQAVLPADIHVSFEFDQSPHVTSAMRGVAFEGALAAGLVGLMVFLFLRDWRSVIVVVLNIPFALIAALVALWLSGQSINLMTLGGLALAVGILVDEATVEVENIHTQMAKHESIALAVRLGNMETAVPRLLAMLCILAVFIPSFAMQGTARALFVPLALAVGFAVIASYILSSTFLPVLCVWLLKNQHRAPRDTTLATRYDRLVRGAIAARWIVAPIFLLASVGIAVLLGNQIGTEIFPQVDAGQFQFRLKAPTGTRIEQTEATTQEALRFIDDEVRAAGGEIAISAGYVGVVHSSYPINTIFLWMGGPEEAVIRLALKEGPVRVEELKARLRAKLPDHLRRWVAAKWKREGEAADDVDRRAAELQVAFEPADIVNEVMSFGSPSPIEVAVSGPRVADSRAHAEKVFRELGKVPGIVDLRYVQALDYPTVEIAVDREKAGASGVTAEEVARSITPFTSSSRFTVPNYWRDPTSGVGYQVQVEIPFALVNSPSDLELAPVRKGLEPILMRDVGRISPGTMPGEIDRYNMRRLVSMTGNIQGTDLGAVASQVAKAIDVAGPPPPGVRVDVRGQVAPLNELFRGLGTGLAIAVVVIALLLLAYFQSIRLALVAVAPIPAVLAGVAAILLATGTTLNLQSFMGA